MADQAPVLMYHKAAIRPEGTKVPGHYVHPRVFRRQMRLLRALGMTGVSVADLTAGTDARRPVAITFDDGYANFVEYALPVLEELEFGATVFVVTGLMGKNNAWDTAIGDVSEPLMTWDQARYCASVGIEIGCHTVTHARLTDLEPEESKREIQQSFEDAEREMGHRPISFCYPYGAVNEAVAEQTEAAGFAAACTVAKGVYERGTVNPFWIPRVNVRSDTLPALLVYKMVRARLKHRSSLKNRSNLKNSSSLRPRD